MSIARITALVATGSAAAIVLTACSSSGSAGNTAASAPPPAQTSSTAQQPAADGGTSATASKSTTATETEFHIALGTKKFSPGTWTFHVKNAGTITHALTVDGPGVDKSTSDISPGKSATLTVTLKPGSYEIFCPVGNHKMEGMDENVTVS